MHKKQVNCWFDNVEFYYRRNFIVWSSYVLKNFNVTVVPNGQNNEMFTGVIFVA